MLSTFSCFCCRLLTFFLNYYFIDTIRVSNGLEPDQDRQSVGPDLVPNYFQKLPTDDKSRRYLGKS